VLQRLLTLRNAVHSLAAILKNDTEYSVRNDGNNLENLLLSDNEWLALSSLLELLKPFVQVTDIIGGSHYPTLSMMYPAINKIRNHLAQFMSRHDLPAIVARVRDRNAGRIL
jgi:hypothetical protein